MVEIEVNFNIEVAREVVMAQGIRTKKISRMILLQVYFPREATQEVVLSVAAGEAPTAEVLAAAEMLGTQMNI